ncbi:ribbon-helix-helix domain-containing protein [Erythrobacter donghaensis]|jgi:hypothetical protein|uniref:ribbon-helix-helix domain-containing protein n=1 Tax=Erythrobacter donghaensis TaxID=267135 RepID=UPI0009C174AE|nr:ribbon-helix-helix domain-containing protein [Erythrobacter donghaensis]
MASNLIGSGVSLSQESLDHLDAYAKARGISRAEAIRASISVGLPMLKLGIVLNTKRALTILEYSQLALSLIVQEQYPDDADHLMDQAQSNAENHHG